MFESLLLIGDRSFLVAAEHHLQSRDLGNQLSERRVKVELRNSIPSSPQSYCI